MKTKFKIVWFILVIMFLFTSQTFAMGAGQKHEEEIRIGAVLPLTGMFAYFGELNSRAIQLAINDLKEKGHNIEYFLEDNQSSINKGVTAAKLLIETRKIDAIVTTPSPLCLAVNHLLEKKEIVHIALSAHPDVLKTKANTIRAYLSADNDGTELANHLNKFPKLKDILIVVINDDYGMGFLKVLQDKLKGKRITKDFMNFGQKDFRNQLIANRLREKDGIIISGYGSSVTVALIKQVREIAPDIKIFGTSSFANSTIRKLDMKITNGIVFSSTPFDLGIYNDSAQKIIQEYKAKFDDFLNLGQTYAYDSVTNYVKYLYAARQHADSTPRSLYGKIFNPGRGVIGAFRYDSKGEIYSETKMGKYANGKIIVVE